MLLGMRKTYDAAFKAKVAFEAAKGEKTIAQLASEYNVHTNQIRFWRNYLMEQLAEVFSNCRPLEEKAREGREAELYEQTGRLNMELEWLKKITDAPRALKRAEVKKALAMMTVVPQCELLELSRSMFYYQPLGKNAYNLALMRLIDEEFTKRPIYGMMRMTARLRAIGYRVNLKRVRRLMRVKGWRRFIRSRGCRPMYPVIRFIPIF